METQLHISLDNGDGLLIVDGPLRLLQQLLDVLLLPRPIAPEQPAEEEEKEGRP